MNLHGLPEDCISHFLAMTGPRDACRSAAVSTTFRSAVASDTVWERFLPSDYAAVLARAASPVEYDGKRDLYFRLCDRPVLVDGGKMSFALDKSTGAKCYMLSARALTIVWGDSPRYWRWIELPDSRFKEAAELLNVCWLEIRGKIESKILSPRTTYAAYLVFKLTGGVHGFSRPPLQASVMFGDSVFEQKVRLQSHDSDAFRRPGRRLGIGFVCAQRQQQGALEGENMTSDMERPPGRRDDGWMEMELGEFYNEDGLDGEVEISLLEVKGGHWKSGLIIQGIEIRPKH